MSCVWSAAPITDKWSRHRAPLTLTWFWLDLCFDASERRKGNKAPCPLWTKRSEKTHFILRELKINILCRYLGNVLMKSSKYCWGMESNVIFPTAKGSEDWREGAKSRDFRARGVCLRQVDPTGRPGQDSNCHLLVMTLLKVCETRVELNPPEKQGFPPCSPTILIQWKWGFFDLGKTYHNQRCPFFAQGVEEQY